MSSLRVVCGLGLALLVLAGCGGGSADSSTQASTATATSSSPTISGQPATSVTAGTAYGFTPTTTDPSGGTLTFSVSNLPSWASFSKTNGMLSGTPASSAVGTYSGIVISVSDGKVTAALPSFAIQVTAATGSGSTSPTISGQPGTAATAGQAYSFTPTASDPSGNKLTFSISNAPSWASFNTSTGQLSGTPQAASVGTYSNIVISVTDGTATASLAAFTVTVTQAATTTGSATLSWSAPTTNTDGTALTNLAGYRIYYGTSASAMTHSVDITNVGLTTYAVQSLSTGTWYFAVKAYTTAGTESGLSNVASKTIT